MHAPGAGLRDGVHPADLLIVAVCETGSVRPGRQPEVEVRPADATPIAHDRCLGARPVDVPHWPARPPWACSTALGLLDRSGDAAALAPLVSDHLAVQRLRNMKPDAAALIGLLVRLQRGPRILEIGTSNGYSTSWLADAARDHGGRLLSVEIDPDRVAQARVNLARAGLTDVAEVRHADGLEVLAATPDSSVTGVVLDAERPAYAAYWPHVLRILAPGGFVAVDNALSHADELTVFRDLGDTTPGAHSDLLDLGDGLLIITRRDTPSPLPHSRPSPATARGPGPALTRTTARR